MIRTNRHKNWKKLVKYTDFTTRRSHCYNTSFCYLFTMMRQDCKFYYIYKFLAEYEAIDNTKYSEFIYEIIDKLTKEGSLTVKQLMAVRKCMNYYKQDYIFDVLT